MSARPILFWEPSVSPHKLALVRALIARGHPCLYIAQETLPAERAAQGWALGDLDDLDIRIAPDRRAIRALIRAQPQNAIHLFSGIRHVPVIVAALAEVLAAQATFAILSEPRVAEGWKGALRRLQSRLTERTIRRRAAFVLAIGRNGPPWFQSVDYPRIFPFAYFLPSVPSPPPRPARVPTIGYLGRLTEAKGIGLFLDAMSLVKTPAAWIVAGPGDQAARVMAHRGVDYRGALSMQAIPDFLAGIDILIQPSRCKDGWGAVVSEALLAGAQAIATHHVGASIVLDDPVRGATIDPNPAALAAAIDALLARGATGDAARAARAAWAEAVLTGTAGAARLDAIIAHVLENGSPPPPFPPPAGALVGTAPPI